MNLYKVNEVAAILDISEPTIRRYTRVFRDHLSEAATPDPGLERMFTDDDLRVLAYCRTRSRVGVPMKAILEELPTAQLPDLATIMGEAHDRALTAGDGALTGLDSPFIGFQAFLDRLADSAGRSSEAQEQAVEVQASIAESLTHLATNVDLAIDLAALRQEVVELRRDLERLTQTVETLKMMAHTHFWKGN